MDSSSARLPYRSSRRAAHAALPCGSQTATTMRYSTLRLADGRAMRCHFQRRRAPTSPGRRQWRRGGRVSLAVRVSRRVMRTLLTGNVSGARSAAGTAPARVRGFPTRSPSPSAVQRVVRTWPRGVSTAVRRRRRLRARRRPPSRASWNATARCVPSPRPVRRRPLGPSCEGTLDAWFHAEALTDEPGEDARSSPSRWRGGRASPDGIPPGVSPRTPPERPRRRPRPTPLLSPALPAQGPMRTRRLLSSPVAQGDAINRIIDRLLAAADAAPLLARPSFRSSRAVRDPGLVRHRQLQRRLRRRGHPDVILRTSRPRAARGVSDFHLRGARPYESAVLARSGTLTVRVLVPSGRGLSPAT